MLIFTSVAWIDTLYKCHIENISTLKNNDEKPALYKRGFQEKRMETEEDRNLKIVDTELCRRLKLDF